MPTEVDRLRRVLDEIVARFQGLSREDVLILQNIVASTRGRQELGKLVRSILGWISLLATTAATIFGIWTAIRGVWP